MSRSGGASAATAALFRMRPLRLALATLLLSASHLTAQVTRRDLADAYLEADAATVASVLPDSVRARLNAAFDGTTLAFFSGNFAKVVRDMHAIIGELRGDPAPTGATRALLRWRLRVEPQIRLLYEGDSLRLSLTRLYADSGEGTPRAIRLTIRDSLGKVLYDRTLSASGEREQVAVHPRILGRSTGRLIVEAHIVGSKVTLRQPLYSLMSDSQRIALRPLVAAGRDPLARRHGDQWLVLAGSRGPIPSRLFIPTAVRAEGAAAPLLIALHGAGGDENMFFEGYGQGCILDIAAREGLIVLSPEATAFGRDSLALDSALALIEREVPIDRTSIWLIGHSMGGGIAARLAQRRPDQFAAAVLLAPALGPGITSSAAPMLVIGAEQDGVIRITNLRTTAQGAISAGAPLIWEPVTVEGHTSIVGASLERAVRWLREHPRRDR